MGSSGFLACLLEILEEQGILEICLSALLLYDHWRGREGGKGGFAGVERGSQPDLFQVIVYDIIIQTTDTECLGGAREI